MLPPCCEHAWPLQITFIHRSSVKNQDLRALFFSWPTHSPCGHMHKKESHNERIPLLIFYIQIPSKQFCKDQCSNILYMWKSIYLWKLFLYGYIFTISGWLLSGIDGDNALFTIWNNLKSFISKNFQILATAFEWFNSKYMWKYLSRYRFSHVILADQFWSI